MHKTKLIVLIFLIVFSSVIFFNNKNNDIRTIKKIEEFNITAEKNINIINKVDKVKDIKVDSEKGETLKEIKSNNISYIAQSRDLSG